MGAATEENIKEDVEVGIDVVIDKDMVEEVEDTPHASVAVRLVMSRDSALRCVCSTNKVRVMNM